MNTTVYWIISIVLALIPIGIWIYLLFNDTSHEKGSLALIFFGGVVAVGIIFGLDIMWVYVPNIDPFLWIDKNISNPQYYYAAIFIVVGISEELAKQFMLRKTDDRKLLIHTVNDSIKLSLAAALGFAFTENIFYFYKVMQSAAIEEVIVTVMFRSIFTTCAHMIFSGIFGYFYGIAKFTLDISRQHHWEGKIYFGVHMISRMFKMPYAQAFREYMILKGLMVALVLHAIFNFLLQMNQILPTIFLVIAGYAYLHFLLKRKSGHLVLVTDIDEKKSSTMVKKDEDVVLELMGMWFDKGKYVDVVHICERLLERDPDNNVVKLFQAKAMDHLDESDPYRKVLNTVLRKDRESMSVIHKHRKVKHKESLEREKNKPQEPQIPQKTVEEPKKEEKEDDTFKIEIPKD